MKVLQERKFHGNESSICGLFVIRFLAVSLHIWSNAMRLVKMTNACGQLRSFGHLLHVLNKGRVCATHLANRVAQMTNLANDK